MPLRPAVMRRLFGSVVALPFLFLLATGRLHAADVSWNSDVSDGIRTATKQNRPVFLMMKAGWCGPCHRMLRESLANPQIVSRLNEHFVPILVDVDQNAALAQKLKIDALPTVLVFGADQKTVRRVTGFQTAEQLDTVLKAAQKATPPARESPGIGTRPPIEEKNLLDNPYAIPSFRSSAP